MNDNKKARTIKPSTEKKLFALSKNQCYKPNCTNKLITDDERRDFDTPTYVSDITIKRIEELILEDIAEQTKSYIRDNLSITQREVDEETLNEIKMLLKGDGFDDYGVFDMKSLSAKLSFMPTLFNGALENSTLQKDYNLTYLLQKIYSSVNSTMTTTYWNIRKKIVEEEQEGKERAEYGKFLLKKLSVKLTKEFKRGYSEDNLKNMRRFYIAYSKSETLSHKFKLSCSKIGKLKHQDIGQMMMYVNHYDRVEKQEDENPTVGIILCRDKSKALVEMTLPKDNSQIYASKYLTVLPDKEEFRRLLEEKSIDDGE